MNVVVIGSGTMGLGIAQIAATNNCKVLIIDKNNIAIENAKNSIKKTLQKLVEKNKITEQTKEEINSRIGWSEEVVDIKEFNPALVIEAIIENIAIKKELFTSIELHVSDTCILASNTSSLSITAIASACKNPARFIGIHFFNPAPIMALVEIIPAIQTSKEVLNNTKKIIDEWKKITVIAKDTPGFIVNRIARPFYSEAIRIHEEGKPIEIIDMAMKLSGGFKMGPFELMDMIGHDVNYAVTESVWSAFYFDTKYTPSFTQKRLVEANWLGKKSGRGFYDYTENASVLFYEPEEEDMISIKNRILVMLLNEAANALQSNIATKEDIDIAMTKGVNYPKGLLQWADEMGIVNCVNQLDELYNYYHEDRYRCCILLRSMANNNQKFY
jgi:3-hydroxybutyryl-CoA dehydrogenase